jgi:hypothetical protein
VCGRFRLGLTWGGEVTQARRYRALEAGKA